MKNLMQVAIIFFLFFVHLSVLAQEKPYFQQEVNYKIEVRLDDEKHILHAFEEIEYVNNSPHNLTYIYFHLWANAYKDNTTAFAEQQLSRKQLAFSTASEKQRGFIDSLDFRIDGQSLKIEYDVANADVCKVILNKPLAAGARVKISTPFRIKLPVNFSRLGHIDQSYQITQWYPKPAVIDVNGWNPLAYLDLGEFYSEFGTFDVSITLPKNYIVGATGDLQTESERSWLLQKAQEAANTNNFKKLVGDKTSAKETKTLRYVQKNVHDFAWFADKEFIVMRSEVELPVSKRKVETWAMFSAEKANLWKNVTKYLNSSVYYYSLWNGEYPYNQATAILGGRPAAGGMEYPTITLISESYNTDYDLDLVIAHEVGHNWFYGILGSNERLYAWMDEGINSFNELRYTEIKYPTRKADAAVLKRNEPIQIDMDSARLLYYAIALELTTTHKHFNMPVESVANQFPNDYAYYTLIYYKSAAIFNHLRHYLGEPTFDRCMKKYFNEWKFKHPYPTDLKNIFEKETGKDLYWFFNGFLQTTKGVDYEIKETKKVGANVEITIYNNGLIQSPFPISGIKDDKTVFTKWVEGFRGEKIITLLHRDAKKLVIDFQNLTLDENRKNNDKKIK